SGDVPVAQEAQKIVVDLHDPNSSDAFAKKETAAATPAEPADPFAPSLVNPTIKKTVENPNLKVISTDGVDFPKPSNSSTEQNNPSTQVTLTEIQADAAPKPDMTDMEREFEE